MLAELSPSVGRVTRPASWALEVLTSYRSRCDRTRRVIRCAIQPFFLLRRLLRRVHADQRRVHSWAEWVYNVIPPDTLSVVAIVNYAIPQRSLGPSSLPQRTAMSSRVR